MNKFKLFIALWFVFTTLSCGNEQKADDHSKKSTELETPAANPASFDLSAIPLTDQNAGEFPYLSTPDSYRYSDEKNRAYEEKFFFYNDSLVHRVGGKYYHAAIFPKENTTFSETYVVNNYKKAIENLGGVEIYSGPIHSAFHKVLEEKPPYLKDLYDPFAYKYSQFLIKTPKENIWIELIHGLNTDMIDFTVLKEEVMNETITILQADEIQKQLDDQGKVILYINFDTDKSTLKPDGEQMVNEIAKMLTQSPDLKLSVEGHTDNSGSDERNKKLSVERAETVVKHLINKGITATRIQSKGFGSEVPLLPNDTEENKSKNRRVELLKL